MLGLDKRSSVPLYAQLKTWILERIESGEFAAGEKIPTELALCELLELSRPTIRQAISELVSEGKLYIEKGKGTFVTKALERLEISNFSAFTFSSLLTEAYEGRYYIDYRRILKPKEELRKKFKSNEVLLKEGLFEVVFTQTVNKKDFVYVTSYLPVSLYPDLLECIKQRQILEIKDKTTLQGEQSLYLRAAQNDEARYLDIPKGAVILVSESFLILKNNQICEYIQAVYRSDFCKFSLPKQNLADLEL